MRNSTTIIAGICISLSFGALSYFYFKNRDKDKKKKKENLENAPESKQIVEFSVLNYQVPLICGRNGVLLKNIEEKTDTSIRFREGDNEDEKFCSINGFMQNIKKAKELIEIEAKKTPTITDEIFIPQTTIEANCGLQDICQLTSAKVWIDSGRKLIGINRRVLITGTKEQVERAKSLIGERMKEIEMVAASGESKKAENEPKTPAQHPVNSNASITATESPRDILPPTPERLKNSDNQLMEVYVSAVNSPNRFWVQLIGHNSTELDLLVDAMTAYYDDNDNRVLHKIREPYLGQIVAANFGDGRWYRAEIISCQTNEFSLQSNPEIVLDLFYCDYGDSKFSSVHEIFELRADFLSLRFQAIEVYLAHVQPKNELMDWEERAIEEFEHMVLSKKLISKVVAYKERKSFDFDRKPHRETSPMPGVELYCKNDDLTDKNIAIELVKGGYAEMCSKQFGDLISKSSILKPDLVGGGNKVLEASKSDNKKPEAVKSTSKVPEASKSSKKVPEASKSNNKVPNTSSSNKKVLPNASFKEFDQQPKSDKKSSATKKATTAEFLQHEQNVDQVQFTKHQDWNEMMEE
ncbi:unnamed protein product [Diamesa hyperborea]